VRPRHVHSLSPKGNLGARGGKPVFPFESPRLWLRPGVRNTIWTLAAGEVLPTPSERTLLRSSGTWRYFDPFRSKLAAAFIRGLSPPALQPGDRVLYLGAAGGTTVSHVADLVGPEGWVWAVERSPRPFGRLLEWSRGYRNILPFLADARRPSEYSADVPLVDALYADVSDPAQAVIVQDNAEWFLREGGRLLWAVKLASLPRDPASGDPPRPEDVPGTLGENFSIRGVWDLAPFHRRHVFLEAFYRPQDPATLTRPGDSGRPQGSPEPP
jgi:fibrillarin-like rRNA methylase